MRTVLPTFEIYFYLFSWICGILYSTYHVYLLGNQFLVSLERDLVKGWSILDRSKDDSDEEWSVWVHFILQTVGVWVVVNYIGSRIFEFVYRKGLPVWYFALTSMFLLFHYGINTVIIFSLQPALFVAFLSCRNYRSSSWLLITLIVSFFHYYLDFPFPVLVIILFYFEKMRVWLFSFILYHVFTHEDILPFYAVSHQDLALLQPTIMWIYLRCISFYFEEKHNRVNWNNFLWFFGYVFYLPCFFTGPIILFSKFSEKFQRRQPQELMLKSLRSLVFNNVRYIFWLFFVELFLHYVYINALLLYINDLTTVEHNVWIMYGVGFGMGQFFFLKYTVVYGLATTWAEAEGYDVPQPPKCVACICLYSDMWRSFDEGLYLFIHRYIYQPCLDTFSYKLWGKLFTSFLCFLFVFIWHGLHDWVLLWSFLNFGGIVVESLAREISRTKLYSGLKNFLGPRNESRLIGIICAPVTIIAAISNFCFIGGGTVIAKTYFDYIFRNETVSKSICLWFFVYCLCQVSLNLVNRKAPRKKKYFHVNSVEGL